MDILPPHLESVVLDAIHSGEAVLTLSARLSIPVTILYEFLHKKQIVPREIRKRLLAEKKAARLDLTAPPDEVIRRVVELYQSDTSLTFSDVAERLQISTPTVKRALKAAKIPIRRVRPTPAQILARLRQQRSPDSN